MLLVKSGDKVTLGNPYISNGKVVGKIVSHGRGDKINVIKFKRRKNYIRKIGHRQWYTDVEITDIKA